MGKYLRIWKLNLKLTPVGPKRILQALAIICICLMLFIIYHKGFADISVVIQENPDDFWRALFRYFMDNLAGGGGEG